MEMPDANAVSYRPNCRSSPTFNGSRTSKCDRFAYSGRPRWRGIQIYLYLRRTFLSEYYVRSGAWIDAIGLKCATFNRAQGKFEHPPYNRPYHGGNGGRLSAAESARPFLCLPDKVRLHA